MEHVCVMVFNRNKTNIYRSAAEGKSLEKVVTEEVQGLSHPVDIVSPLTCPLGHGLPGGRDPAIRRHGSSGLVSSHVPSQSLDTCCPPGTDVPRQTSLCIRVIFLPVAFRCSSG